ncbi:MAG: hypothetical protein ACFFE1_17200 [Candidatus Thorarchaeota archaeon]
MEATEKHSDRLLLTKLVHLSRVIMFASLPVVTHISYTMYLNSFLESVRDWYGYYPALSPIGYPILSVYPSLLVVVLELRFLRRIWRGEDTAFIWTLGLITFEISLVYLSPGYLLGVALLLFAVGFAVLSLAEAALIFISGIRTNDYLKRRYAGFSASNDAKIVTVTHAIKVLAFTIATVYIFSFRYHWMGIANEHALALLAVDILALYAIIRDKPWAYEALIVSTSSSYLALFLSMVSFYSLGILMMGAVAALFLFSMEAVYSFS